MIKDIREGMEENMEAYHMMDGAEVMGVLVEAVGGLVEEVVAEDVEVDF